MSEQQWVAIIEDDESLRASIARVLRVVGIPARDFGSAEEFLSRAAGDGPTCIVLDIHLGAGLNGFELRERLESDGELPPIIFMTGHAELLAQTSRDGGAGADFLRKPFDTDELIARVRRHLPRELGATGAPSAGPGGP